MPFLDEEEREEREEAHPHNKYLTLVSCNLLMLLALVFSYFGSFKYIQNNNFIVDCLTEQPSNCATINFDCGDIDVSPVEFQPLQLLYTLSLIAICLSINLILTYEAKSFMTRVLHGYNFLGFIFLFFTSIPMSSIGRNVDYISSLQLNGCLTLHDNYFRGIYLYMYFIYFSIFGISTANFIAISSFAKYLRRQLND